MLERPTRLTYGLGFAFDQNPAAIAIRRQESAIRESFTRLDQVRELPELRTWERHPPQDAYMIYVRDTYHAAINSPHQDLYREVLFAAALARTDELGYFAAGDLRYPRLLITERNFGVDRYMGHPS